MSASFLHQENILKVRGTNLSTSEIRKNFPTTSHLSFPSKIIEALEKL
jgi:hypothetical protein